MEASCAPKKKKKKKRRGDIYVGFPYGIEANQLNNYEMTELQFLGGN